jgi:hypothetical protein
MATVQWTEQPDDLRVFDKKTFVSSLKLISGVDK